MSSFAALFGEDEDDSPPGDSAYSPSGALDAPPSDRAASNFVGLDNQGATCYMNSLLQTWFMTPEIRGALYSLDPERELHAEHMHVKDVSAVRKLKSKAPRQVPLHLQKLFTVLQHAQTRSVTTSELTRDGFGWQQGDARIQHDLDALYNELVDAVQKSLVKTSGEDLIRRLLAVRITHGIVTLTEPPYRSPKIDLSFSLQLVNLKGVPNVTSALEKYFQVEHLDDGKPVYIPESGPFAGQKVPADRVTELQSCPPILAISVNRTTFDFVKLQAVKMKDRFDCPLVLDMRPYFVSPDGNDASGGNQKEERDESEAAEDSNKIWGANPNIKGWGNTNETPSPTPVTVYPSDLKTDEDYARAKALSESAPDEPLVRSLCRGAAPW